MYVDTNYSAADILGQQFSWGLAQATNLTDLDGVTPTASTTNEYYYAAPLVCSWISSCDKLIPTGLMAPIRIQLTLDSIANVFTVAGGVTSSTVVQAELCFTAIDMGVAVENMVASMSPKLYLKSEGWANSSQSLAAGTTGFNTLVYNHRYESIKNLYFLSSSNTVGKAVNTWGDSFNPLGTAGANGSFQVQIGSDALYPQLPINNATGGIASVQQYLRETVGFITDNRNTMSIYNGNFNQYAGDNTVSTVDIPAKCIFGLPCAKLNSPSPYQQVSLMSGVSAASMPINVLLNVGTGFFAAMNLYLIAQYDQLLEIDVASRQVSVIC